MPAPTDPHQPPDATQMPPPSAAPLNTDETAVGDPTGASGTGVKALAFGQPAAPGEVGTLGPYRIVKQLGRGGMGAVYAAVDTRLGRRVALKLMLGQFAADPAAKERFLREARAAAQISHDNVVTVHEADERNGVPYIVMQFLEGYPLDEFLRRKGEMTLPQLLRVAREAAAGLAAAHRLGLVHRDIKPANLWLEAPEGRVKVLDFGLVRPVDGDKEVTKSGEVVGTPAYMSPEQARGKKVDHRTDLFSLGAVLYRLCTGRLPFEGDSTMAVLMALGTEDPPPIRELNPTVPEPLAALIHRLLAKRADDRPQSADEVVEWVRAIAAGEEVVPLTRHAPATYPVIQVTGLGHADPFAELDADVPGGDTAPSGSRVVTAVGRKPAAGGGWTWALVGAALLLAVGGGVFIATRAGSKPTEKADAAPPPTTKGRDVKPVAVAPDPDRKAAEWALGLGGAVQVNGQPTYIKAAADLPRNRFTLNLVDVSGKPVSDAGLAVLRDCKGLDHLVLGATSVTDAGLAHLAGCKSITALYLYQTKITDAGLADLAALPLVALDLNETAVTDAGLARLKDLKDLRHLLLQKTGVTDAGLAHVKALEKLTHLELADTKVTDAGLVHLAGLTAIESLNLRGTGVTGDGLTHFKNLAVLRWIDLGWSKVTDAGIAPLADLKGLTRAELNNNALTDACVPHLTRMRGLTHLIIRGTGLTDAALPRLRELPALTDLDLGWTKVTDAGLPELATLPSLTTLTLNGTPVTDAGLTRLGDIRNLTSLQLYDTGITDAGLVNLAAIKGLTYLSVKKTRVTPVGLAEFHAAVPGCKVDHDAGTIEPEYADRKAADWVLSAGGTVRVDDREQKIGAAGDLPRDRFTLTHVVLEGKPVGDAIATNLAGAAGLKELVLDRTGLTDQGLARLAGLNRVWFLSLGGTPVTDAGAARLKAFRGVSHLSLADTKVTDAGLAHLKDLRHLVTLWLINAPGVTDAGLAHLKDCHELTHLDVRGTKTTLKGLAGFHTARPECEILHDGGVFKPVDRNRQAAEWVFSAGGRVRVNGGENDIGAAGGLPKEPFTLSFVGLEGRPVADADLGRFAGLKGLAGLAVSGTPMTDAGLARLKRLPAMLSIWLVDTKVTDAGLEHLAGMTALQHIDLGNTAVGDAGLAHIRGLTNMYLLWLYGTKVTDAGLDQIRGFKRLGQLNLAATAVTDDGLARLKDLKELHNLILEKTAVTDAGLAHLTGLTKLTTLDVRGTKVTAKGLGELHAAIPGCKITHDAGVIEPKK